MTALLALGRHVFTIAPLNYQKLERQASFRWAELGRLATEPAKQFVGPGAQSITINGMMFPESQGGYEKYKAIEKTGRAGKPVMMVGGTGLVFGRVVILEVSESHEIVGYAGMPRQMGFSVKVGSYGSDRGGLFGGLF